MVYKNQKIMNDAIQYWSDRTLSIGSFNGVYGFRKLLHHAILELDYDKWEQEERGMPRMFLCTLDFNILNSKTGRSSLRFRNPSGRNPAPPGMIHIWDILMANWRTIKVDDFGRVEIRTVFPTSILPTSKLKTDWSISNVLTDQEILDYERSVYNTVHNGIFLQMSASRKIALMDEHISINNMQAMEERLRLDIKKQIDEKIIAKLKQDHKTDEEKLQDIKLDDTEDNVVESENLSNLDISSVEQKDINTSIGGKNYSQRVFTPENVLEEFI